MYFPPMTAPIHSRAKDLPYGEGTGVSKNHTKGNPMQIKGDIPQNKLIILFVFDKMESPLSERTLNEMCSGYNSWITYVTPEGRDSLANFYIRIPLSVREVISRFVKTNGAKFRMRQECKSDYYQNKDGSYTVFLRILAPLQPMLELKFVVQDKKTASNIYKKWEDKASELYSVVYETLVD